MLILFSNFSGSFFAFCGSFFAFSSFFAFNGLSNFFFSYYNFFSYGSFFNDFFSLLTTARYESGSCYSEHEHVLFHFFVKFKMSETNLNVLSCLF